MCVTSYVCVRYKFYGVTLCCHSVGDAAISDWESQRRAVAHLEPRVLA
jgi:hypothetical protein